MGKRLIFLHLSLCPLSLCTSLCLQWEPQAIAIAFIHLAGKLSKFDLVTATQSKTRSWWRQYLDTLDIHDLESICHQVLDIYGEEEVRLSRKRKLFVSRKCNLSKVSSAIFLLVQKFLCLIMFAECLSSLAEVRRGEWDS